jgi:hypothetical protein
MSRIVVVFGSVDVKTVPLKFALGKFAAFKTVQYVEPPLTLTEPDPTTNGLTANSVVPIVTAYPE